MWTSKPPTRSFWLKEWKLEVHVPGASPLWPWGLAEAGAGRLPVSPGFCPLQLPPLSRRYFGEWQNSQWGKKKKKNPEKGERNNNNTSNTQASWEGREAGPSGAELWLTGSSAPVPSQASTILQHLRWQPWQLRGRRAALLPTSPHPPLLSFPARCLPPVAWAPWMGPARASTRSLPFAPVGLRNGNCVSGARCPVLGGTPGHPPAGHMICWAELSRCCFHLPVSLLPEFIEVPNLFSCPHLVVLRCPLLAERFHFNWLFFGTFGKKPQSRP